MLEFKGSDCAVRFIEHESEFGNWMQKGLSSLGLEGKLHRGEICTLGVPPVRNQLNVRCESTLRLTTNPQTR